MKMKTISKIVRDWFPRGLFGLMLTLSVTVFAQSGDKVPNLRAVSGIVTDAAFGTPMVGVRVQAYNNSLYAAMTKEDGSYTINVPEYVTSLIFALEGCNTSMCHITEKSTGVDMKMFRDVFSEIYSSRTYGTKSKTASIESMNADLSVDQQIQSKLSGDIVTTTRSAQLGAGNSMLLGGINSLNINTQPLIILDGIFIDMEYQRSTLHDGFYNNILSNIMVDDIEKVTLLKNGLAIYGAKGANGVILIDTKRNKSMATVIDLSIAGNYQLLPKFPEMMKASQYRNYVSELLAGTGTKLANFKFLNIDPNYYYYNTYHNETDWKQEAYDESFVQSYSINVQGGDDLANYNLSVGFALGDATLKESSLSRFNLRLNSDIMLANKMFVRFDASYSDVTRDLRDDGVPENVDDATITSPGFLSLIKSPFLSPYAFDNQGNTSRYVAQNDDYLDEVIGSEASLANPLAILRGGESINKNYFANRMITMAITPRYEFSRYFSINEHFSYTLINSDENYYLPINGTPSFEIKGIGVVNNKVSAMSGSQTSFMSNTYLKYEKRFKAHFVNMTAGFRYLNNSYQQNSMIGYNSGNDKMPNMTTSLLYKLTEGIDDKDISLTYWAQGNYNYREKYYLFAGLGVSASSRFGGEVTRSGVRAFGVPWGVFPSVAGSWVISSEPWFNANKTFNYLKLNAGFDITGNDGFDDTASRTYFSPVRLQDMTGLAISNIGNNSLQWEVVNKVSLGLDVNMFDNHLSLSANVFSSVTNNLLSISALSYLTGIENSWSNGGALKNSGYDFSFNAKLLNLKDLSWELGASIGHYKNEVTELPDNDRSFISESYNANILTAVGNPVGVFYGYQTDGVFSTTDQALASGLFMIASTGAKSYFEAGDIIFRNNDDSDFEINSKDMVVIGDPNPDFYGHIFTKINYKRFTLSSTVNYSFGNDVFNYQRMILESGSRFNNQTLALVNRWTVEGQVTDIPKISYLDSKQNSRFSDRWIEDGSYLKLKNVTLSYKLPVYNQYIKGITVWGAANNLLTITNYLGSDPEFSTSNNILTQGIDRGLLPQSTNFSLGVKINL